MFVNSTLIPWAILLTAFAWGWLIWRCFRRKSRHWFVARLIFTSLALFSLLLAILQPTRFVESPPGAAVLLTNDASASVLDSLQKAYPRIALFQLGHERANAIPIPDLTYLGRNYPAIRQLFIVGNGLNTSDLQSLGNYRVTFFLNPEPKGITDLNYTERLPAGKTFRVNGVFNHQDRSIQRLVLESPAGNNTVLTMEEVRKYPFELAFQSKEAGRYLFKFRLEGEERQILSEQVLPVEITASSKPAILILNAAPAFETNYLKNWLADVGYPVAVRSTISRDKFRSEFHNRPEINLESLNLNKLQEFDLILLSTYTLDNLSQGERNLLRQAVDSGLGLCLLAEKPFPPNLLSRSDQQYFLNFPLQSGSKTWAFNDGLDLVKIPLQIGEELGLNTIVKGDAYETIAAYRLKGKGRVALNLVNNTYELLLEGQNQGYQQFWTPILEQTARQEQEKTKIQILEAPVLLPDEPLTIQLFTTQNKPTLQVRSPDSLISPVFFRQHPFDWEQWQATYWPRESGWYELRGAGSEGRAAYVQELGSWESLKIARQLRENRAWRLEHQSLKEEHTKLVKVKKPYPLWWFYLSFLLAAGLLWLEEKWI